MSLAIRQTLLTLLQLSIQFLGGFIFVEVTIVVVGRKQKNIYIKRKIKKNLLHFIITFELVVH